MSHNQVKKNEGEKRWLFQQDSDLKYSSNASGKFL